MAIGTAIAIYFIFWWVTLFITLPFQMRSQLEAGEVVEGSDPAAPARPAMLKRMLWNTVVSAAFFFLYWFIVYYLGYGLDSIPQVIELRRLNPA